MHQVLEKYIIKVFGKGTSQINYSLLHSASSNEPYTPTVGFTVAVMMFWIPSLIMMIVGCVFRMDCPASRYIPVYLIMSGLVTILTLAWLIVTQLDERFAQHLDYYIKMHQMQWFLLGMLFIWFLLGSYFVLKIAWPTHAQCHPVLYRFAFVIISAQIFFIGFVVMVALIVCCSSRSCCKYCSRKLLEAEEDEPTEITTE